MGSRQVLFGCKRNKRILQYIIASVEEKKEKCIVSSVRHCGGGEHKKGLVDVRQHIWAGRVADERTGENLRFPCQNISGFSVA